MQLDCFICAVMAATPLTRAYAGECVNFNVIPSTFQ